VRLVEKCAIEDSIIGRPPSVETHVRAVDECEGGPGIICDCVIGAVRFNCPKGIKTIVVTCCTIGEVHRCSGVVETVGIDHVIVDGNSSLVKMSMPIDIYIDAVLIEETLERGLDSWVGRRGEVPT
jgi:hypothetical protein